jgi:hypothetical protein
VRTGPKTERIGERRMRKEDIGSLKKPTKGKSKIEKRSFNSARNLMITAVN